jgi:molybdopterin/thiamine biosynthesis adenylyltransferase
MKTWWSRYPEAFEAEKAGLNAIHASWTVDEAEFTAGRLVIDIEREFGGMPHKLKAVYPDSFPYFLPQVFLAEVAFDRHQQPFGKNLCLLGRDGAGWQPGQDTLAMLLEEQFPKLQAVSAAELSSQLVADQEDHVGEPFSSFLPYSLNCAVIVPDKTPAPEKNAGSLLLQIRPLSSDLALPMNLGGVIRSISDLAKNTLIECHSIPPVFSQQLAGFWLRLPARPDLAGESTPETVKEHFLELMASTVPAFRKTVQNAKRGQILLAGFVYPDEVSWRSNSDDWFFIALRILREAKGARPVTYEQHFVRVDWGGEKAWLQRAPSLLPLRAKSALVIGLGSLGSALCLHLARAGVSKLNLVDCDQLQVGNTVRWALGWKYAGLQKSLALSHHLSQEYPYTTVHAHSVHIGNTYQESGISDYQLIRSLCEQSDLIIDAAANHRVSHFLADLARELGKPYLWLTTTHGAAGGVVGRIIPGKTEGCWHCFQHSLADGSIGLPADTGTPEIQPGGCSQPTFIGAGVDSDEIALLGARLAVATLSNGEVDGYPNFFQDVFVGDLNKNGMSIAPEWKSYNLPVNLACKCTSHE